MYKQEVRSLTANDVGWQFTASRAHAAQFSDFQMASVIATAETRAPLLWDLFDHLFCVDAALPSEKITQEELQFKRDVVSISNNSPLCFLN